MERDVQAEGASEFGGVPNESSDSTSRRTVWAVAAAITAFAIIIRSPALGPSSLWRDDAWQAFSRSASTPSDILAFGLASPGFSLLLALVLRLPGRLEILAQAVPFLASSGTAGLIVLLAHRVGARIASSAAAGIVFSLSGPSVTYAARVKPYALDGLLCLVAVAGALAVMKSRSIRSWWWFGCAASVAALSSAHGLVATAATLTLLVIIHRRSWRRWLAPAGVAGCAVLGGIVLHVLRNADNAALGTFWRGSYLQLNANRLYRGAVGYTQGYLPDRVSDLPLRGVFLLTGAAVLVALAVCAIRRRPLEALICFAPVAAQILLSFAQKMPFGTRVDLPFLPSSLLALTLASRQAPRALPLRPVFAALAGLVVVALGFVAVDTQRSSYPNIDIRPLVRTVRAAAGPNDIVFVDPESTYPVVLYWESKVRYRSEPRSFTGFAPLPLDERLRVAYEPLRPKIQQDELIRAMTARSRIFVIETVTARHGSEAAVNSPTDLSAPLRQDPTYRMESIWVTRNARASSWTPVG